VKRCSKCERELGEDQFVKSPRYLDGLYPSCKECRKDALTKTLEQNPLCSKCGVRPHRKGCAWCSVCRHQDQFKDRRPKFRPTPKRDSYICPKCDLRPKLENHGYCRECKNDSTAAWEAKRRGGLPEPFILSKKTTRHYVNTLFQRGKIKRKPCEFCGAPSVNFHHLDYYAKTTNIQHVCHNCHVLIHSVQRKMLTLYGKLEYLSPSAPVVG
jgi:hypothetical protein